MNTAYFFPESLFHIWRCVLGTSALNVVIDPNGRYLCVRVFIRFSSKSLMLCLRWSWRCYDFIFNGQRGKYRWDVALRHGRIRNESRDATVLVRGFIITRTVRQGRSEYGLKWCRGFWEWWEGWKSRCDGGYRWVWRWSAHKFHDDDDGFFLKVVLMSRKRNGKKNRRYKLIFKEKNTHVVATTTLHTAHFIDNTDLKTVHRQAIDTV